MKQLFFDTVGTLLYVAEQALRSLREHNNQAGEAAGSGGHEWTGGTESHSGTEWSGGTESASGTEWSGEPKSDSGTEWSGGTESASGTEWSGEPKSDSGTGWSGGTESASGTEWSGEPKSDSGTEWSGGTESASGTEWSGEPKSDSGTEWSGGTESASGPEWTCETECAGEKEEPVNPIVKIVEKFKPRNIIKKVQRTVADKFTRVQAIDWNNVGKFVEWGYSELAMHVSSIQTFVLDGVNTVLGSNCSDWTKLLLAIKDMIGDKFKVANVLAQVISTGKFREIKAMLQNNTTMEGMSRLKDLVKKVQQVDNVSYTDHSMDMRKEQVSEDTHAAITGFGADDNGNTILDRSDTKGGTENGSQCLEPPKVPRNSGISSLSPAVEVLNFPGIKIVLESPLLEKVLNENGFQGILTKLIEFSHYRTRSGGNQFFKLFIKNICFFLSKVLFFLGYPFFGFVMGILDRFLSD